MNISQYRITKSYTCVNNNWLIHAALHKISHSWCCTTQCDEKLSSKMYTTPEYSIVTQFIIYLQQMRCIACNKRSLGLSSYDCKHKRRVYKFNSTCRRHMMTVFQQYIIWEKALIHTYQYTTNIYTWLYIDMKSTNALRNNNYSFQEFGRSCSFSRVHKAGVFLVLVFENKQQKIHISFKHVIVKRIIPGFHCYGCITSIVYRTTILVTKYKQIFFVCIVSML